MAGLSALVVVSLTAGVLYAYASYRKVWDRIKRIDVTGLGSRPPQFDPSAVNLLVFASGTTDGLTRRQQLAWHVGSDSGDAVSETLMIVHISPGHHRVTVVNIPRDTVVPIYNCAQGPGWSGQQASPGSIEQIDATLSYGGPACLWKTVEHVTGVRLDHFIELGYKGLVRVIDDIGGVDVCLPFGVHDPYSGLNMSKGQHHIDGVNFLKFWRTREATGDGSDLQRITRDDYLLARALSQALRDGLLSSPTKLIKVISDAASQMTLDAGFSQSDLLRVAESLRGLPAGSVQFIQAPTAQYAPNPNWVEPAQPQDDALFQAIAHDRTVPRSAQQPTQPGHQGGAVDSQDLAVAAASPSSVDVTVLNGDGVPNQAGTVAADLAGRGFHITGTGDASVFTYTDSVIEYGSRSQAAEVEALRQVLSHVQVQRVAGLGTSTLELIVGSRYNGLKASGPKKSPQPSGSPVANLAKTYGGITGTASCTSDTAAFQGPLTP
ncbi:MAG TPA: LCP family protein [Streptosporangiaceae bacterium]|nr:LCP family protein [Streptosporangiaceae bacterium]